MLTHNAPSYVKLSIDSLKKHTKNVDYELVVVDNQSKWRTRYLLKRLYKKGKIDTLKLNPHNSLFAGGNNIAATLASKDSDLFLLLNSDIEVKDDNWLSNLIDVHKRGITSYGLVDEPLRVDGYCMLIDADLYLENPLDEGHQWYWAITKQQAKLLRDGHSVQGYSEHEKWLHHFGGKSGSDFKNAKGMDVTREEVYSWFDGKKPNIIDESSRADNE